MDTALDQDACWRAVVARDARFDGRFFTGVVSTGIYCRPVCPARTPNRENVEFHRTAAAAEAAGLRACLRCRPETAPDFAGWRGETPRGGAWRGTANTVSRALALIEAGALDTGDTEALAARLGLGERQLRRLFRQHLGAAPVSVAQTRRVLLAKQLIHETDLPMSDVALAAGFGSVRRFNETFQALYGRAPSDLRRRKGDGPAGGEPGGTIRIGLSYRPPYDWLAMMHALATRGATDEAVADGAWTRRLRAATDGADGSVTVRPAGEGRAELHVRIGDLKALPGVLARVRRVFDLAADPEAIARDLSADPRLKTALEARPGLRPAGDWIDMGEDAPSDRLTTTDAALLARAEHWRPWRAYGALYWTLSEGLAT
ncbi:Bifunctional transcriptional activator/DNA repair enzyme AdaA [Brevundimonas sp. SH203]|uniref:bifunctional transcriptional activator/DNA repair enzyme AdaA n=1 Tax=Brevundimonas sp. SH203 TaxID=345167 RepID=UPI0009C7DE88|nr:Ada metal-binding domain-containing protein [Brevundimonas sp. SH203]GAW40426.1 Bifunctional transcriptional activator/DNA repair enzyme AdaA [Brevundimonas sp. SH203]